MGTINDPMLDTPRDGAGAEQERDLLEKYLSVSARQLDESDVATVTVESLICEGRARRGLSI